MWAFTLALSAPAWCAHGQKPLACQLLTGAEIARALGQPVAPVPAAQTSETPRSSHCQWTLSNTPNQAVTLTIDRHTPAQIGAAWQSVVDTYGHAAVSVPHLRAAALWLPRKWGTTGLLYLRGARTVSVLALPQSDAKHLDAAISLARLLQKRVRS